MTALIQDIGLEKIRPENIETRWNSLFKIGGISALVIVLIIPIQSYFFIVFPPPTTVIGFFELLQRNWFIGLMDLDLLYIINTVLMIFVYLALYIALRKVNESFMLIALITGLTGTVIYFSSTIAFEMLSLGNQYVAAPTEAERSIFLAAGETMLTIYKGTAFDVYYIISAFSLLLFAIVMLQSHVFSKTTAYFGLASGIFMVVPSTAGTIGLVFAFTSLIPWAVFSVLIALKFFEFGKANQVQGGSEVL